jgi:hypothetical protein
MRRFILLSLFTACSNAADPKDTPDAAGPDAAPDASGPPLDIVRVNEVAAAGSPADWIEVVNASSAAVELSEYCFIDSGPIAMCSAFPAMSLAPGAYFAIDATDETNGFKLGGDEEVSIFRIADQRLSDKVDWNEGDSPAGEAFARIPDSSGPFARTNMVTRAAANLADNPSAPLMTLLVNEVAANEPANGDWVEFVNGTTAVINLADYCFIDSSAVPCKQLPVMDLAPGAYFVHNANDTDSGFGLGNDELVTVKRVSDMRVSDSADWNAGEAGPAGAGSFQRVPTITGTFMPSVMPQTKNAAN